MSGIHRPSIVVSVGTDHHPFDRLMAWTDAWVQRRPELTARLIVQRGTSRPPRLVESVELLAHRELLDRFASAAVVVTHGGPSTVMDARVSGRMPIVVPRHPARGEHVDDHQLRFAGHLERHGLARIARDEDGFGELLDAALSDPAAFAVSVDAVDAPGVVAFGRAVDRLLDVATPVRVVHE